MRIEKTVLPGVLLLYPERDKEVFRDPRGAFHVTYHRKDYAQFGIRDNFVQDNLSCSKKGVLRGLHYQLKHPQAKLCQVLEGEVLDVVVEIRRGSPHYGKSIAVRLSAREQNQIYIPAGYAHGFLALAENTRFLYKCSDFYHPGDEKGILWSDPQLGIPWNIAEPILSRKDREYGPLEKALDRDLPKFRR